MSIEEENKAAVRRHVEEVFNKGNLAVADEIISPDYVYHSPFGLEFKGPEGVKQMVAGVRKAFPDLHITIDDMVAEGDKVVVRYTETATHKDEFGGIPPTGRQITMTGVLFYRMAGGKEVEAFAYTDLLALFQQLGVSPPGGSG